MTTRDITESLRNLNTVLLVGGSDWSDILLDAALEIERLRAENNLLQAAQGMLKAERDALQRIINEIPDREVWLAKRTIAWEDEQK